MPLLRPLRVLAPVLLAAGLAACPSAPADDDDSAVAERELRFGPEFVGGDRPARVVQPSSYDGRTDLPIIVLLHGYGASADLQEFYFQLAERVDEDGFLLVLPDGTTDESGSTFWNAFPASTEPIDDVGYLMGLVDELQAAFWIDAERVSFMGHSNGGFMSYRLACEHASRIAGIVSLAGLSPYEEEDDCDPSEPVSVLQVHGTDDPQVPYDGFGGGLGAEALAERWATRAGCDAALPDDGGTLDLIDGIAGEETTIVDYPVGCLDGAQVSRWTMQDAGHLPYFNEGWRERSVAWLLAQRR